MFNTIFFVKNGNKLYFVLLSDQQDGFHVDNKVKVEKNRLFIKIKNQKQPNIHSKSSAMMTTVTEGQTKKTHKQAENKF